MGEKVTIDIDGEVLTHVPGAISDYATLCGLDGDDVDQTTVPTPRGAKINCSQCRAIWSVARQYRTTEFE